MIDLSGTWDLANPRSGERTAMAVPGDGISALVEAGVVPEPYWGCNENALRWISAQDWVLSRTVTLDDTGVDLLLSGLDCVAEVSVNGTLVLSAQNAFRCYRVDLSAVAKLGENAIQITFRSPVEAGRARAEAQPYPVPWSKNCPIPYGNMLRKPACDFGWDWNIALAPFGLYGTARLEPQRPARIAGIRVQMRGDAQAMTVTAEAQVAGAASEVAFALDGQVAIAQVFGGMARAEITVPEPQLWWPAGQGAQPLYDLSVTCGGQTETRSIGLRTIELVTEDGAFTLCVNGREIYAKGANWIPADALPGRVTREATRDLLRSAVDANMNMIRVWGGGRYEPGWFYEICDKLGLMVWQDFMFACNLYPSDETFLTEVSAEVREVAWRLNAHPSVVLWCGDNELIGALGWYDVSRDNRDTYLVGYDRLNRCVESALSEVLPGAVWWPSSPSPGPMSFGDAWHDDSKGDMHFWSVWHEGRDFDHYRDVTPRFCSEFGFQSFPSMDVIRRFAEPADWNIASPVMDAHQKDPGGNARITETMFRYFRFPNTFEDFVYLSQVQQAFAIKTAVDAWSSRRPRNMGALYWQLNDTWPVASWASLDHGGGWKLLHHVARRFFAPTRVVVAPEGDMLRLVAVNDGADETVLGCEVFALSMRGALRALGQAETRLAGGSAAPIFECAIAPGEMLYWRWPGGADHFAPKPYKAYDLREPKLSMAATEEAGAWRCTLSAEAPALFAALEADLPGRFSDNAVLVLPEASVDVTFTPHSPGAVPRFTTRSLYSATH